MIRFVSTLSLVALLLLVLYLPSATPPERFLGQLRAEHALTVEVWGQKHALRILARMLDWQTAVKQAAPIPATKDAPRPNPVGRAVATQLARLNRRLFDNRYFRSIDTLLALAAYRLSVLRESLPALLVFTLAALVDGLLVRIVKSKEFRQHDPERFALHVCGAIVTACATVLALVLPVMVHPLLLSSSPIAISVFLGRAVGDFHRRG